MWATVRRRNLDEEEAPETQLYPELGLDGWWFQENSAPFRTTAWACAQSDVLEESAAAEEPQETQMYPDSCKPEDGGHLQHWSPAGHAETWNVPHKKEAFMGQTCADAVPHPCENPVTFVQSVLVVPLLGGRIAQFLWHMNHSLVPDLAGMFVRQGTVVTCLASLLAASRELQLALVVGIKEWCRDSSNTESFASLCDAVHRLCPAAWASSGSLCHFRTNHADKEFLHEFLTSREAVPTMEGSPVVLRTNVAAHSCVQAEVETLPQTQPFREVPETQVNEISSVQLAASEWHDDPAATQWYFPDDVRIVSGRGIPSVSGLWRSGVTGAGIVASHGNQVRDGLIADHAEPATQLYTCFSDSSGECTLQHMRSSASPPPSRSHFSNLSQLSTLAPQSHREAVCSPPRTLARRQSLVISVPDTDTELEQGLQWSWAEGASVPDTNQAPTPPMPRLHARPFPAPAPRKRPRPQVPLFPGLEPSSGGRKAVPTSAGPRSSSTSVGIGICSQVSTTAKWADDEAVLEAKCREEEDSLLTQCYGRPLEPAVATELRAAAAGSQLSTPPRGGPRSIGKGNHQLLHEHTALAVETPQKELSGARKRPAAAGAIKGAAVKKRPAAAMNQHRSRGA